MYYNKNKIENMTTIYKLSDIKPIGNLDFLLKMADDLVTKLEAENQYTSKVADFLKFFVGELGTIDILETFETPYEGWNMEEQKICLLYAHIIVIRCNNIAQKYLNNIEMPPIHEQLMEYIESKPEYKKIFGYLKIEL